MKLPKYYEDTSILHVGTEENHAYFIPFQDEQNARCRDRLLSEQMTLLSGEWKFAYYKNRFEVPQEFMQPDFDADHFDEIPVPSCWQSLGYDRHQYTNVRYPFPFDPPYVPEENPCGAYITEFGLNQQQVQQKNYLHFEGVDSCFYVWVNGEFVGYSQVSHSTSEFDISKFVVEGSNKLAVLVMKWCDGSYLEDQDKLRMSGIFRDVYLLHRPQNHIFDYTVTTPVADDFKTAAIELSVVWSQQQEEAECKLYAPDGTCLQQLTTTKGKARFEIAQPVLWNAEQPALYELVITANGETILQEVGIKRIDVKDAVMYINGVNVKIKGVNRHDSDPVVGYAVTPEHIEADLLLMKQHNFNALRTSHYPNSPWLPEMCARLGFYMIAEADLEIHGTTSLYNNYKFNLGELDYEYLRDDFGTLCHDPRFEQAILDRTQRNVIRDKNCCAVVMWSLGNESGFGPSMEKAARWIKEYDPTRLTHYEGSIYKRSGVENDLSCIDVYSRMYATPDACEKYCVEGELKKPVVQCEFVHAMGNGPGDIEEYFKLIYKYDQFMGGFVWEWCDHAVWMGRTVEGKDKYFYGGDFGEFPHDGNFCMDGLVYPDRTPHTGLLEWKNVTRPVRAQLKNGEKGIVCLHNCLDFTDLQSAVELHYEITCNGEEIESNAVQLPSIRPHEQADITLPYNLPAEGTCCLNLYYLQKDDCIYQPAGTVLGFDQFVLREQKVSEPVCSEGKVTVAMQDEQKVVVEGETFRYVWNKLTGLFDEMVNGQITYCTKPQEWNIWRAPTDNDSSIKNEWKRAGYDRAKVRVYETAVNVFENAVELRVKLGLAAIYLQRLAEIEVCWKVLADGTVRMEVQVQRNAEMPFLPRFGVRMFLPESFTQADYFGYGPQESYIDKRRAALLGRYTASVSEMHEDYIRPQENGSHCGCCALSVSAQQGGCFSATGDDFSFNLSVYTQEELEKKAHNFELVPSGATVLCIDYKMSGVGSNSCGPRLREEYQLNEERFDWSMNFAFNKTGCKK